MRPHVEAGAWSLPWICSGIRVAYKISQFSLVQGRVFVNRTLRPFRCDSAVTSTIEPVTPPSPRVREATAGVRPRYAPDSTS